LDFIQDGQTVVLKPNLVTPYTDSMMRTPADLARITVAGKQPGEVAVPFAGQQADICPGL
jgi:hypothetical protein